MDNHSNTSKIREKTARNLGASASGVLCDGSPKASNSSPLIYRNALLTCHEVVIPLIVTTSNVVTPNVEKTSDDFQTVGKNKKRKGTDIANITRKRPKSDKNGHENGK
nr:hypothetical protein [Tanacetum cinerariifolium]